MEASDPRLVIVHQIQLALQGKARIAGVSVAKADVADFLDANDLWTAHKLSFQCAEMQISGADLIFTDSFTVLNN